MTLLKVILKFYPQFSKLFFLIYFWDREAGARGGGGEMCSKFDSVAGWSSAMSLINQDPKWFFLMVVSRNSTLQPPPFILSSPLIHSLYNKINGKISNCHLPVADLS